MDTPPPPIRGCGACATLGGGALTIRGCGACAIRGGDLCAQGGDLLAPGILLSTPSAQSLDPRRAGVRGPQDWTRDQLSARRRAGPAARWAAAGDHACSAGGHRACSAGGTHACSAAGRHACSAAGRHASADGHHTRGGGGGHRIRGGGGGRRIRGGLGHHGHRIRDSVGGGVRRPRAGTRAPSHWGGIRADHTAGPGLRRRV